MRDEEFIKMRLEEGAGAGYRERRRAPWLSRLARRLRHTDRHNTASARS